jgi:hypothetical protein
MNQPPVPWMIQDANASIASEKVTSTPISLDACSLAIGRRIMSSDSATIPASFTGAYLLE